MKPPAEPDLDAVFAALSDPTRRAMLSRLLEGPCSVGTLAAPLPMSLAAVSKHLQVLRRGGLVSQVTTGREKTCRLEPDALRAAFVWMEGFGAFEAEDYAALERCLEILQPGSGLDFDQPLGLGEID